MQKLNRIGEYSTSFLHLVNSHYNYMFHTSHKPCCISMQLAKSDKECNQCITRFTKKKKPPKECDSTEIVPITWETQSNLNIRIYESPRRKGIISRAYKNTWRGNMDGGPSISAVKIWAVYNIQVCIYQNLNFTNHPIREQS